MRKIIRAFFSRAIRYVLTPMALLFFLLTFQFKKINQWLWDLNHGYLNPWATIIFNLSSFPFKIGIKMPVFIYEKIAFLNKGTIIIAENDITAGMIKINILGKRTQAQTKIENYGKIILKNGIRIFSGTSLTVLSNAIFSMDKGSMLGENVIIFVENSVKIGIRTAITFNSIVTDTNSHFMISMDGKKISKKNAPVEIGDFNWIGNCTSIKAGVKTPPHLTVASSYSVLTKDYTHVFEPFSIVGGCPAQVIKNGFARIFDVQAELALIEQQKNGTETIFSQKDVLHMASSLVNYQ